MNVTFHALASLATAAALSCPDKPRGWRPLTVGSVSGVLIHGVLDILPHAYPIPSLLDVLIGTGLFLGALWMVHRGLRPLLSACFVGAILPDVIDLGPAILNKHLGWSLPVIKLFPWHWPSFSGSVYDGSRDAASLLLHMAVILSSTALIIARGRKLFRPRGHF